MIVVKGHVQVADVVDWCDADHISPLKAGRISGTQFLRILLGSLRSWVIGFSKDGIRAERVDDVHTRFEIGLA